MARHMRKDPADLSGAAKRPVHSAADLAQISDVGGIANARHFHSFRLQAGGKSAYRVLREPFSLCPTTRLSRGLAVAQRRRGRRLEPLVMPTALIGYRAARIYDSLDVQLRLGLLLYRHHLGAHA